MVIIGLGSNIGDREAMLARAVASLGALLGGMRCSPVYESKALLPQGAPDAWNMPFLNMAVAGRSSLAPQALLAEVKALEALLGRKPRGHWGPREIDLDILACGDRIVFEADLILPHAALLARDFALVPLADVAPRWTYPLPGPAQGKTAQELARTMVSTLTKTDIAFA